MHLPMLLPKVIEIMLRQPSILTQTQFATSSNLIHAQDGHAANPWPSFLSLAKTTLGYLNPQSKHLWCSKFWPLRIGQQNLELCLLSFAIWAQNGCHNPGLDQLSSKLGPLKFTYEPKWALWIMTCSIAEFFCAQILFFWSPNLAIRAPGY